MTRSVIFSHILEQMAGIVQEVIADLDRISPQAEKLEKASQELVYRNKAQVEKVQETIFVANSMSSSFTTMLVEVEESLKRAGRQAEISAELTMSNSQVTDRVDEYLQSVLKTSTAIEEMARSLKLAASRVEELAESAEKTTSSAVEISATTGQVQEYAEKTFEYSQRVQQQAAEGIGVVEQLGAGMKRIAVSSGESVAAIGRLTANTDQIDTILNVITEIVEHTKLLSLNASIIAAQAGSRGASFAVVANEVRELANRTSASTSEIAGIVHNIKEETAAVARILNQGREHVTSGVESAERTDQVFRGIEEGAVEVASMMRRIADATREQTRSSQLIASETEQNFQRVQQVGETVVEQERQIDSIVGTLERMKTFSSEIKRGIEAQTSMNGRFLDTVNENYTKSEELRSSAMQMLEVGDQVLCFILEAGKLIETNAEKATVIVQDIARISGQHNQLISDLKRYRKSSAGAGGDALSAPADDEAIEPV